MHPPRPLVCRPAGCLLRRCGLCIMLLLLSASEHSSALLHPSVELPDVVKTQLWAEWVLQPPLSSASGAGCIPFAL